MPMTGGTPAGAGDELPGPVSGLSSGGRGPKSELRVRAGLSISGHVVGGLPLRLGPLDRFSLEVGFFRVQPGVPPNS